MINETEALRETIAVLHRACGRSIHEFLIVTCERTTLEARTVIAEIRNYDEDYVGFDQSLPYLRGPARRPLLARKAAVTCC